MDAQSAYGPLSGRTRSIGLLLNGRVERFAAVGNGESQPRGICRRLNFNLAPLSGRIRILHHIDHSLLHRHFHPCGKDIVQLQSGAYPFYEGIQPARLADVVGQTDPLTHQHITLRPDVLDSHHRQVVALFGIPHKLMNRIRHPVYKLPGLLLFLSQCPGCHLIHTAHLELRFLPVHRLRQSVSKQEYGSSGVNLRLLRRVFP